MKSFSLPLRFLLGIALVIGLSLGLFYWMMQPLPDEIGLMAQFLTITAALSALAGYIAYRVGWMQRSPTLRWTLLGGYVLASALTFLNVWMTARLMFTSQHDLLLATVLLLFAAGIAMVLGYFLSTTLTDRIAQLKNAAGLLARGGLDTRVAVDGRDELAVLAHSFNEMAAQLQETARQRQELENLRRDLIAWASHDLQTPLASIRAMLEALADGVVDDEPSRQRYLATMQRDTAALSQLIDDLFQMAQIDAGGLILRREQAPLRDLISDTLESFSELANRSGVQLVGSVSPDLDVIWMDVQRIGRVLNNLISNALRHSPRAGTVTVYAWLEGDNACVEVVDQGEGIPAQDLPHIFERFYRGEKSRNRTSGGAGLGLAIAKGVVEAHGGRISVQSEPGRTRFTFSLPQSIEAQAPSFPVVL